MINPNGGINSVGSKFNLEAIKQKKQVPGSGDGNFSDAVGGLGKKLSDVSETQQTANMNIKDLLAGKNEDINTVVASVAKADMSFKLLVGVRNKLVEAYKKTMNMPV